MMIPEHSGKRLESLTHDELCTVLQMRVDDLKANWVKPGYTQPANLVNPASKIVEVLNAMALAHQPFGEVYTIKVNEPPRKR